ncbi:MAG TPA: hypothetical protein VFS36_01805 [Chitinophagaceae bacterium]|jgi:hypothetical protein|nr:hypothetical protein [Chitinophagaceae bacterium]HWC52405.1 hypothetical protein [Chitinophagaceae bacterium]
MNNTLSLQLYSEVAIAKPLAPIVPMGKAKKERPKVKIKQTTMQQPSKEAVPSFYTEPIFKPKKHDML